MWKFGYRWFRTRRAIDMWLAYNRRIIRFARQWPERACVVGLHDLTRQFPALVELMRSQWGLELRPPAVSSILDRDLLHSTVSRLTKARCRRRRDVDSMYNELQSMAITTAR